MLLFLKRIFYQKPLFNVGLKIRLGKSFPRRSFKSAEKCDKTEQELELSTKRMPVVSHRPETESVSGKIVVFAAVLVNVIV